MSLVVTGLSQNGDTSALRAALQAAALPTSPLQVIGPGDASAGISRGLAGSELLKTDGGTGVPGINSAYRPALFFTDSSASERLGDLEIPDSEIGNFVEALERGRSVVAYYAQTGTVDRVEAAFRAAGLLNVRRY